MSNETSIKLSRATRDGLRALKRGGESYDALLRRLIEKVDGR